MSKILIKKGVSTSRENKTGLVLPLFKIENDEYLRIESNDFPSTGTIFVSAGFNEFEEDTFYEFDSEKLKINDNYNRDLAAFTNGEIPKSPSKYILSYYHSNIKKTTPQQLIPIYDNRFSLTTNKLIENVGIDNRIFFLKEAGFFYGPFERDGNELKAASFKDFEDDFEDDDFLNFIEIYSQYDGEIIFKISFDESNNFIVQDDKKTRFLVSFENFVRNNIGLKIDCTPIPNLHKWAVEKLANSTPKLSSMLSELKNVQSPNNTEIDKLKWDKYISLFEEITKSQENIDDLVKILNNKNFIKETINSSKIEELNKEIEELKKDVALKGNVIVNLRDRNVELNTEIDEERKKTKESSIINTELFPNLSEALNIEEKIIEIENLIASKKKLSDLEKEFWKLEGKKETFEKTIEALQTKENEITSNIESISNIFKTEAKDYTAKLAEAKIYTDLLNGIEILPNTKNPINSGIKSVNIIQLNPETTAKTYIYKIHKRLAEQGRELPFNEVVNLVITINQNFITIIAGAPGVGKTSLVEKLSKSYGLNEDFGYLEIACAKGWTSSRDLIGFFNPLTQKYQSSKTNLKDALEKSERNPNAPYLVLLDEANLSPIEHYWSDFIKLADINYPRKIKISENQEIQFGDGFRFIATINHDHTTESLSNRLIDRAAIIQLEKLDKISTTNEIPIHIKSIVDHNQLQSIFIETQKWKEEKESIEETFNKIKEKLESNHSIIISPRKEIAIFKYCQIATGLFDDNNKYTALDYAISQHILPLINGRGESFQKLLEGLKSDLNDKGMNKSEKLLSKIIERGKELKHFRYIYY